MIIIVIVIQLLAPGLLVPDAGGELDAPVAAPQHRGDAGSPGDMYVCMYIYIYVYMYIYT